MAHSISSQSDQLNDYPPLPGRAPHPYEAGINTGSRTALLRGGFTLLSMFSDCFAIILTSILIGASYNVFVHDALGYLGLYAQAGLFIALFFLMPNFGSNQYAIAKYMNFSSQVRNIVVFWNLSFFFALLISFLTKTTAFYSRGGAVGFYIAGLIGVIGVRAILVYVVASKTRAGRLCARRIFVIGYQKEVAYFANAYRPQSCGMNIVASAVLQDKTRLSEDLNKAVEAARATRPDDIFILTPWTENDVIDACVNAFVRVPAAIHLGPEGMLKRYMNAHVTTMGGISSMHLVREPLTLSEVLFKRSFDIIGAIFGLILLCPVLLLAAVAIKLDSKGPVLFLQRRYGFNREPFRILKFRTMTACEDGAEIPQAVPNDPRVTRVGRFLRRTNIDELPQLVNVLLGDMSLVGPRPHALAHDHKFEQLIAFYARRHNMRPGITGWAQVSGCRGETNTEEKMRRRVDCDLFYIDNWSSLFDLQILFLTIFSKKAYRNAY